MPLTVNPATLTAAATALAGLESTLATDTTGVAGATTVIAPAGTDSVSIQQAAVFSAFGTTLQTVLAQGQDYASQFQTNLGNASDTYSFTEATNAANTAASSSSSTNVIDLIAQLLGGPSGSLNGEPFSLSSNTANIGNIGAGNWASAMSDLLGMAGGGLLPAGSDTIGDAAASAALASDTMPVGAGMGGFGAMPMAGLGQGTLVGNLSTPPSWGGQVTPVTGTSASPMRTVGWTAAAPEAASGTFIPGMPGMVSGARSSAGFGAPRYGVKPIVMPKPATV